MKVVVVFDVWIGRLEIVTVPTPFRSVGRVVDESASIATHAVATDSAASRPGSGTVETLIVW